MSYSLLTGFAETCDGQPEAAAGVNGHARDAEGGFYLGIGGDVVLRKFLQAVGIQRKMQHAAEPGDAGHESAAEFPDVRLSAESLADDGYEFVGRERLVVAHVVDPRRDVPRKQAADCVAYILHRSEGAQVVESAERPRNSPGHDRIEQIEIAFVARAVDHAGTQDVDGLARVFRVGVVEPARRTFHCIRSKTSDQIFFRLDFALAIGSDRCRDHVFGQDALHSVRRRLRRGEEDKLLRAFACEEPVEDLLCQAGVDLEIDIGGSFVLRVVGLAGQMDHRVDLGDIAGFKIIPGKGLCDARLLRRDDVKAVYRVVPALRQVSDKVGTHEPVDSGDEDGH